jgi:hypothetical protein
MIDQPTAGSAPATAPAATAPAEGVDESRRTASDALANVRATDLEPYTGLRYLSTLFRVMAVILILLLIAEIGLGVAAEGTASLRTLVGEASRLIVLAGVLWGTGDLATLLVDIGHDVRASRILMRRMFLPAPGSPQDVHPAPLRSLPHDVAPPAP